MILARLKEYAERLERDGALPPEEHAEMPIRWLIELDEEGRFLSFSSNADTGRKNDFGKRMITPALTRTSGVQPLLLADKASYVLGSGLGEDPAKAARVHREHESFVALVRECAEATDEPAVRAVLAFLESEERGRAKQALPEGFEIKHNLTFRVGMDGVLPVRLLAVQRFWTERQLARQSEATGVPVECPVCSMVKPPALSHTVQLKRVPGGQPSGTPLVSMNFVAGESYGLERAAVAAVCHACASAYARGANVLLTDERTHLRIGDQLVYLFWTRAVSEFDPMNLLSDPQPDDVRELLRRPWRSRVSAEVDSEAFYALALSGNGGRVVVRDWLESTVPRVKEGIARYFTLQQLVASDGEPGAPLGIFSLLRAAAPLGEIKRLPPQLMPGLVDAALRGTRVPPALLWQALTRLRAGGPLTYPLAVLIKMTLSTHPNVEEAAVTSELNPDHPSVAYHCGRLLAVLEAIQRLAIPGINKTIVDRYFGTASSAPASVFGNLLRGAQSHLSKLRSTNRGAQIALEQRLEEVMSCIGAFPAVLTLTDQGLFALGFYHQKAHDRKQARERKQQKEAATMAPSIEATHPIAEEIPA